MIYDPSRRDYQRDYMRRWRARQPKSRLLKLWLTPGDIDALRGIDPDPDTAALMVWQAGLAELAAHRGVPTE